jgi:glycosyltransferase involved in cell wall biosynthesis
LRLLARVLGDAGHDLLLLSFGQPPEAGDAARNNFSANAACVRLEYVSASISERTGPRWIGVFRTVRRALGKFHPDVYFACGTGWNLFAPAVFGPRTCNFIFHEVMSGETVGWRDPRWLVSRFFDLVVAQATPVAGNFKRMFGWNRPVPVIPAFATPLELTSRNSRAQERRVPLGTARAAIFSRLVPHKRVAWLVAQWPRLNRYLHALHVFGSGPEQTVIQKLISENGWSDVVFYHGKYPGGEAYFDLLSSFDLTLLPTTGAEGAPLVLLESMACGVPFVATDAGGISDYANPDCVIVPRDHSEAFLRGVDTLCERLSSGATDSARLRDFYQSHFGFEVLKREWLSFFESAATS